MSFPKHYHCQPYWIPTQLGLAGSRIVTKTDDVSWKISKKRFKEKITRISSSVHHHNLPPTTQGLLTHQRSLFNAYNIMHILEPQLWPRAFDLTESWGLWI